MPSELIWYGLGLFVAVTVYWAAIWWWFPKFFRDRERDQRPK